MGAGKKERGCRSQTEDGQREGKSISAKEKRGGKPERRKT